MKILKILVVCFLNFQIGLLFSQEMEQLEIEEFLNQFDENTHIEIGVYDNGVIDKIAYSRKGKELVEAEANPDQLFEIGSITKLFTAYITHTLIDSESGIKLNSKLTELGLPFGIHRKNKTTLLHLLNHTSNLPKMPMSYLEGMIFHSKNPYKIYTEEKVLKWYRRHKTKANLGNKFKYSNFGYGILGIVVSKIREKPFREVFDKEININLGLHNTQIGIRESEYSRLFLKDENSINCLWDLNKMESEGGGYSTITDLLRFAEIVIEKNQYHPEVKRVLELMEEETIALSDEERIAMGWRINVSGNKKLLYHDGGSRGYKSFIAVDCENKLSVVILSQNCGLNKNNKVLKKLGISILDQLEKKQ